MPKQVSNSLSTYVKAGLVFGASLAASRQVPQTKVGASDSLVRQGNARSLQQINFTAPAANSPSAAHVASPPPVAAPMASGYFDILAGNNTEVCGAVVPDWNHYGACSEPVNATLSRVTALSRQGCHAFKLDLYETDTFNTAAYNATTMSFIAQVAAHAESLGMVMLVGPSKDDVTMNHRVPTEATSGLMVALADQFGNSTHVGLDVGGLPANNGSDTVNIAETYGNISAAVRATGYKGLLTFTAPENDGRSGLEYFVPQGNRIQDANMRFVVYPYSSGNSTETLNWMQPCVSALPCAVVTGLQVNDTLKINNNINQVTAEVNFTRAHNIPALMTPWDSAVILSDQGEQVMLTGDACSAPNSTVAISPAGQALINLQKGVVG